jgi:hypothetical protein
VIITTEEQKRTWNAAIKFTERALSDVDTLNVWLPEIDISEALIIRMQEAQTTLNKLHNHLWLCNPDYETSSCKTQKTCR